MQSPDAPRPPAATGGRAEDGGAELEQQHTPGGYVLAGHLSEPEPVQVHQQVPNEVADKHHSAPPEWVVDLLRNEQKCEPFPPGGRHHVAIWERLVRRLPVTSQAKGTAAVLVEHWPTITPSLARISALAGLSRSSCDNGLYVLRIAGLVEIRTRPGRPAVYVPCYPARAITRTEVDRAKRWRRNRHPQPAHPAVTPGEPTHPTGRQVPTQPATGGDCRVGGGYPTGSHEVMNEDLKEGVNQDLALPGTHPEGLMGMKRDERLAGHGATS